METTINTPQQSTQVKTPDFGAGRYSNVMKEAYKALIALFGVSPTGAEKVAKQIASDLGAWQSTKNADTTITLGTINKDNRFRSIKDVCKIKDIPATDALRTLQALQFADEAFKHGVNRNETKWKLISELQEYLDSAAD